MGQFFLAPGCFPKPRNSPWTTCPRYTTSNLTASPPLTPPAETTTSASFSPARPSSWPTSKDPGCIIALPRQHHRQEPHHLQFHILRIYWDGETEPSVEAPIGDFFGVGFGLTEKYSSALICIDQRRGKLTDPAAYGAARNCYIPMPFGDPPG